MKLPASKNRIYLSPPHVSSKERQLLLDAFDSNWIAPLGPMVTAFEQAFAEYVHVPHTLALSSGTAALHLILRHLGLQRGEEVFVSDLTFAASVNPIIYEGGTPVFIDSERDSWNMDPERLAEAFESRAKLGTLPRAVIVVHLYGQSANLGAICQLCNQYGVPLIEDAAESLGGTYQKQHTGTVGYAGISSFNGNKIITTSGGGMLMSHDQSLIDHARKMATQARDAAPHYQHSEIGYNYRLSNLLAAVGLGQLEQIEQRVAARRRIFDRYKTNLSDLSGIQWMPEANWGRTNRWLTVAIIDSDQFGASSQQIQQALTSHNIESRPVWKPMHLQPVFEAYDCFGGVVSESLFKHGICLPSGSALSDDQIDLICSIIRSLGR